MEGARQSTGLFFWDGSKSPGLFSITYGAPPWKAEYAQMVESDRTGTVRLGKDGWANLDNSLPLVFGDRMLPVGHWYLAIHKDAEGVHHLAVFDSARLRKAKVGAHEPGKAGEPEYLIAMQLRQVDKLQQELRIHAAPAEDKPTEGRLTIHWGNYALTTPFAAVLEVSRSDQLRADLTTMAKMLETEDYKGFIGRFAPPEVQANLGEEQMAKFAERMGEDPQVQGVLEGLRELLKGELTAPEGEDEIDLENDNLPDGKMPLVWKDGRWYIRD